MSRRTCLAIVLAAGEGTRMRSSVPKALHTIGGRTLLEHVLASAAQAGGAEIAIVVGPDHGAVAAVAQSIAPKAQIFEQRERRGTAHAVLAANKSDRPQGADDILVMFADTPLVRPRRWPNCARRSPAARRWRCLDFKPADPAGYGRLVMRGDELIAIREERDASAGGAQDRLLQWRADGAGRRHALAILERIGNANAKGEYYLTDAVAIARDMGLKAVAIETGEDDVRGINTKAQLAQAEAVLQNRLRAAAMEAGVTMIAPETVFLAADTKFGKDVTIEPNVVFGPGVTVEDGALIRSFSHLEGAHVGKGARVGPFARLRPGAELGPTCISAISSR